MSSKLWKNCIMTSATESYCLLCDCHALSTEDAEIHLAQLAHRKLLDATPYAEDREEDRIRKVPNGFYCEFCNLLLSTSSKVGLHVTDPNHWSTKGNQLFRRKGASIVAYNNISISEKAYHGFRDKTCVLCSKDFDIETIHMNEKEHIIKLIQSKIMFGDEKSIYRKVEDGYQCLTCNEEFLQDTYQIHFSSSKHKAKFDDCKITNNNNQNKNIKCDEKIEPVSVNSNKDVGKPKETINKKEVDVPKAELLNDKEKSKVQKDRKNKKAQSEDPHDVDRNFREALNAENYISDLDRPFCILCEVDIKEGKALHLNSTHHMRLLKLHQQRLAKMEASKTAVNKSSDDSSEKKIRKEDQIKNPELIEEKLQANNFDGNNNNKDKILGSINELTKQGINVNFESSVATCKTCKTDLEFDYDIIINHTEEHKIGKKDKFDMKEYRDETKSTKLFSEPVVMVKGEASANVESSDEITAFAKNNGLDLRDNVYYCGVCGVNLSVSPTQLKAHVTGKGHKNRTRRLIKNETPDRSLAVIASKVPMSEFINKFHFVEKISSKDAIINLKYCVNILSFFMYTRYGNRLRCQVCKVNLTLHDVDIHKMEHEHREKMQNTLVVTSIPDEFIREVQPAVLHCGYCNMAVSETDINNHLYSTSHKEIKRAMMARLHQYIPQIQNEAREFLGLKAFYAFFLEMLARRMVFQSDD